MNSLKPIEVQLVHLFVSGGAGKSHLINTICHTTTRSFRHVTNNTEQPTVLVMDQTGVSSFQFILLQQYQKKQVTMFYQCHTKSKHK